MIGTMTTTPSRPRVRTAAALAAGLLAAVLALAPAGDGARAQDGFPPDKLDDGGYALILRHANAPGTGDPADFELGDCSTQRTLDARGRAQARALGETLRAAGIEEARVYSSQWCRCLQTARELGLGPVEPLPALNSFYGRREMESERMAALRAFLAEQPTDDAERPLVLVTHQVNVTALTGAFVREGAGRVLKLDGTGEPAVAGEIPAPPLDPDTGDGAGQ